MGTLLKVCCATLGIFDLIVPLTTIGEAVGKATNLNGENLSNALVHTLFTIFRQFPSWNLSKHGAVALCNWLLGLGKGHLELWFCSFFFFHSTVLSLDRFMSCPRNRKQGMLLMQCCRTHVILFPCIFIFIVKKYYMQLYIRGRIGVSGCWKLQHSQEFAFIMTVVF